MNSQRGGEKAKGSSGQLLREYSPFTPGVPVPVEFFVGRLSEIQRLKDKALHAAATGRIQVGFLSGERGIGKSSLASFVRHLVEQESMVGLHVFLGGVNTLEEAVRRAFDKLLKESVGKAWHEKVKDFFGTSVKSIGLFGVTVAFDAPRESLREIVQDFAPTLRKLLDRLGDTQKGLFLVLDDINGLTDTANFANWLKSLVDEVATSGMSFPVCILMVGLEERRRSMIEHQPSIARVLDIVEIRAWEENETKEFFKKAFASVGMSIEKDALESLALFAGGLPVLAHEIGDAIFKVDVDGKIEESDAFKGVDIAAEIVGRKYLEPQVFDAIRSQKYRAILKKVSAGVLGPEFKRSELRAKLNTDEARVLDNFLTRMKDLGVIRSNPESGPGAYQFTNVLHYLYISIWGERR